MNISDSLTHIERISDLVLLLSIVATDTDNWKQYQVTSEGKDVVIDRIENQISDCLRSLENAIRAG